MSKTLQIKMPIRTVSELNMREHWAAKHKRRKKQREDFFVLWRQAKPPEISLPCRVTFTRFASKCLDVGDNLNSAFKSLRDELCAILGVDDSSPLIDWQYRQERISKRDNYFTIEVENL
jgi:hypothetical protein